jgi:hypothetical protein
MNGYEKAVTLNITGTDSEIVAILKTMTVGNIPVDAVRTWMREHMIWYRGSDGLMKGSLATAYATASAEHQGGLDYLHATVWGDSATVLRTTDQLWAPQVAQLVGLVETLVPDATALVDEFYALGGGRPYKDYTTEQYETDAATAAAVAERENVVTACLSPIRTVQAAAATRLNNATASLGPEHIDGLTLEQLQARCDAVAASDDGLVA